MSGPNRHPSQQTTTEWPCGHPKTPENIQSVGAAGWRCRTCRLKIGQRSRQNRKEKRNG